MEQLTVDEVRRLLNKVFMMESYYFVGYSFRDKFFKKTDTGIELLRKCEACFADYFSHFIALEKADIKNTSYHVLVYLPTKLVEPLLEWFKKSFPFVTFNLEFVRDIYKYTHKLGTYKYSLEDIKRIKQKYYKDDPEIASAIEKLVSYDLTTNYPECFACFSIKLDDRYSYNASYAIYYLLGVILRSFSLAENKGSTRLFDSDFDNIIKDNIGSSFATSLHKSICETNLPTEVLFEINDIENVNYVFKNEEPNGNLRQTSICEILYDNIYIPKLRKLKEKLHA